MRQAGFSNSLDQLARRVVTPQLMGRAVRPSFEQAGGA
jgi:hypothetical protein